MIWLVVSRHRPIQKVLLLGCSNTYLRVLRFFRFLYVNIFHRNTSHIPRHYKIIFLFVFPDKSAQKKKHRHDVPCAVLLAVPTTFFAVAVECAHLACALVLSQRRFITIFVAIMSHIALRVIGAPRHDLSFSWVTPFP